MTQVQKIYKLIALIMLTTLFMGCIFSLTTCRKNRAPVNNESQPSIRQVREAVTISEKQYQESIALLEHQNRWLEQELNKVSASLADVQQRARAKEKTLQQRIASSPGKTITKTQRVIIEQTPTRRHYEYAPQAVYADSLLVNDCDSLKLEVTQYIEINREKDSLFTQQVSTLQAVTAVKDSVIAVQGNQHDTIKAMLQVSLERQAAAIEEMRYYKRQFKKQRFKSKFFSAVGAVLAGALTYKLIQSQ
jgi:hypothetical protein